eukprot:jgi/Psemu1/290885/fgenesh1_pg.576_\
MDLFGCGIATDSDLHDDTLDSSSPKRIGHGHHYSLLREEDILANKKRHLELMERDYIQLHEDFFDSLLKEEGDRILAKIAVAVMSSQQNTGKDPPPVLTSEKNGVNSSSCSLASEHTAYDQMYNPNGGGNNTQSSNNASTISNESAPSSSNENNKGKKASSSTLSIADIMAKTDLESPSHYLHPQCKLQKDKGKGEGLGNSISAEGREQTLTKLRDKMKLIVEVSGELETSSVNNKDLASKGTNSNGNSGSFKTMSAGIKRRRAKIAAIEHNDRCTSGEEDGCYIIETRSMIEFQLGFLSMQYGLLVRWDSYKSGQIVFVCLRKMCHDSFYTKIPSPPRIIVTTTATGAVSSSSSQHPKSILKNPARNEIASSVHPDDEVASDSGHAADPTSVVKKREITPPFVIRNPKGGNHAIYQRSSGATEVVLVDAPYRVQHPKKFVPSMLSLDVHRLTGLDPKSKWTLIMTFDGDTEIAHLKYNHRERVFETTRTTPCQWEVSVMPHRSSAAAFDMATGLEIRLFEQRPKQRLRGVASGVAGMVGGKSSQSSSYVPPGSDPFSLTSPSNSYIIQNQRLTYYSGNGISYYGNNRISRTNSENSFASNASGTSSSSKKSTSRLASTMTVPLGGLVSQPSTSHTTLWKLTIPFTHDEEAEVTLTLMHQSEYAHWLYRELRARRKEELVMSHGAKSSDLWRCLVSPMNNGNGEESIDGYTVTSELDDTDVYCIEYLYYCCVDTS